MGVKISELPSGSAEQLAVVPVTNASGTNTNKVTLSSIASLATKQTVGLGNVDNTSDADKPVSTAVQSALDLKANVSDLENFSGAVSSVAGRTGAIVLGASDISGLNSSLDSKYPTLNTAAYSIPTRVPLAVGTTGSPSYYGTYDQEGNVEEMLGTFGGIGRNDPQYVALIGGNFYSGDFGSQYPITYRWLFMSTSYKSASWGFRVVTLDDSNGYGGFVTVGDVGNANNSDGFGGVAYEYRIGKFCVTVNEWVTFLNAVAKTDTNGIFWDGTGGSTGFPAQITRTGSSGSYVYAAVANHGQRPAVYMRWTDAARYCNWLHNGKPTGEQGGNSTEDGAYEINSATNVLVSKAGAKYRLPTESEWIKAGRYKGGGTNAGYWRFSTQSDENPAKCITDLLGSGLASVATSGSYEDLTNKPQNLLSDSPADGTTYGRKNGIWVDVAQASNLQLRRGTEAERVQITPLEGEPIYTTDSKKLYIGDGSTVGGNEVSGGANRGKHLNPAGMIRMVTTIASNSGGGNFAFTVRSASGYVGVRWWDGSVGVFGSGSGSSDISVSKAIPTTGNWSSSAPKEIFVWSSLSSGLRESKVGGAPHTTDDTRLTSLSVSNLLITSLDVGFLTGLQTLNCGYNPLYSLDVSTLTSLQTLDCSECELRSLDVSSNTSLTVLRCDVNYINTLDVSKLTSLTSLNCISNLLTELRLGNNPLLTTLDCSGNLLTSLRAPGLAFPGQDFGFYTEGGAQLHNNNMSAAALDQFYSDLAPTAAGLIKVTGNPGTAADNPSIATAKGYQVIG